MSQRQEKNPYITPVNVTFAVICAVVYVVLECMGDTTSAAFMAEHAALYPPAILLGGQWYRLLTAAFLHFGLPHLLNNLILLICLGSYLERAYGKARFILLYLLCAIGGNTVSLLHMIRTEDYAVAGGASGVVFGMIGALIVVVLSHRGHYRELPLQRLLIMLVLCLYFGLVSGGVDNAAHIGGLLTGFVLGWIFFLLERLWRLLRRRKRGEPRNPFS